MLRSVLISVLVLAMGGSAVGQSPVVESLYMATQPEDFVVNVDTYVDITPIVKTVTIPAGTAVF